MFCCETMSPSIHVDVSLTNTSHPNTAADRVHPLMAAALLDGSAPPSRTMHLQRCKNCSGTTRGTWERAQGVNLASRFPRSQSNWASTGCSLSQERSTGAPTWMGVGSGASHRCSTGLGSGEWGGQFDTLGSLPWGGVVGLNGVWVGGVCQIGSTKMTELKVSQQNIWL